MRVDKMALLWADPFDCYGGNAALVILGGYTYASCALNQTAGNVRTGLSSCLINNTNSGLRYPLAAPVNILGQGCALNYQGFTSLASPSHNQGLWWCSAGNVTECYVIAGTNGEVRVYDRTNTLVGQSAPTQFRVGQFAWIEVKVTKNTAGVNTGKIEVRMYGQGVNLLTINGVNLPNQFTNPQLGAINFADNGVYCDDWIVWDDSGAVNNGFMGDRRLEVSYPNANLALQDFTPSAGNAWDRINDAPPTGVPNDTSYIEGTAAGNISEFQKTGISIAANDVAAVMVWGRLAKTDAGLATARLGMHSGAFVQNSAEIFCGTSYGWYQSIIEQDPNGAIPWTKAAVDAAAVRITRQQ